MEIMVSLRKLRTVALISSTLLFGRVPQAQHTLNLNSFFKYDQNVEDYYRKIESIVIARQIAVIDRSLGEKVMALENSKEFLIAFNNELVKALENNDDEFMRTHNIKAMLVESISQTYPQVPHILAQKTAEMISSEQKTEIQAFAGDAPNQFAKLKGNAGKPGTWLTSITDSPLGICTIRSSSGRMELTCVPDQDGLSKDELVILYERTRDSIADALSASIADKHDKVSDFHLMHISTFSLKNGAEVEVGVVGDDRTSVVTCFRTPR